MAKKKNGSTISKDDYLSEQGGKTKKQFKQKQAI